jgi:hypothetical protein
VYQFTLEERAPTEHVLRRVAEAGDSSFVRRVTARFYSHMGQPGIDPSIPPTIRGIIGRCAAPVH